MISTTHTFNVWHPKDGLPADYVEKNFEFSFAVDRRYARDIVSRVEGYSIAKAFQRKRQESYIYKPRAKVQKA